MIIAVVFFLIFVAAVCTVIMGIVDVGSDYAKSTNIRKFLQDPNLEFDTYFYCGDGSIAWTNKWAKDENGAVMQYTELFKGSSTYYVWKTDYFHYCERKKFDLLRIAVFATNLAIILTTIYYGWFALIFILTPFTTEILNHIGFVLAEKKRPIGLKVLYYTQRKGLAVWLKTKAQYAKQ